MQRRAVLAAVGTVAVGLPGCTGTLESGYDVGMSVNAFEPEELVVEAGDRVVWENTSSRGHTVTAFEQQLPEGAAYFASGDFESEAAARSAWNDGGENGIMGPGEQFVQRFEVPGEYGYVCLPHERNGMLGSVVVE